MSEGPQRPGYLGLIRRALRDTLRFTGRSTRSELLVYLVAELIVGGIAGLVASFFLDRLAHDAFVLAMSVTFAIPVPALLVRRLHDFGKSGVWAVPILVMVAFNTGMSVLALTAGIEARLSAERVLWPLDWLRILVMLLAMCVAFAPGTNGPNRFGANPRQAA